MRVSIRLTPNQIDMMRRIEKYGGSIYSMSGNRRTIFALADKGLLKSFGTSWYHLTERGKYYIARNTQKAAETQPEE